MNGHGSKGSQVKKVMGLKVHGSKRAQVKQVKQVTYPSHMQYATVKGNFKLDAGGNKSLLTFGSEARHG